MFTYSEVYAETLKYFGGDVVATSSCINKYLLRSGKDMFLEKSPDDINERLIREFVRMENKFPNPLPESDIRGVFDHFKHVIAQGSPIFGIGNKSQMSSLGNCFVVASPIDNYSSIIQRDEDLVNIMKRRGGCGIDLTNLRPSGAEVNNSARTSDGISCFMERYSNTTKEVAQNGRRGALMITIDCRHPDIERFIMIKRDKTRVTGANISVKWSDEFLKCVRDDSEFTLRFPVDARLEDAKITRKVRAKDIWKMFVRSNWESGEPGCLFWDKIVSQSLSDLYPSFKTISTNPCQPEFATVLTKYGIKTIGQINIGDEIWSETGWCKIINKSSNGIKPVFEYQTTRGSFIGTEEHKVLCNNVKIEAGKAKEIDCLKYDEPTVSFFERGLDPRIIMDGLVLGDGSIHLSSLFQVYLTIGKDDSDYHTSEIKDLIIGKHAVKYARAWKIMTSITTDELPHTYLRKIPNRFFYGDRHTACSFLRGLYTANGSVCGERVTLKSASFELIKQVQIMLSSLGISSYYTKNKPASIKWDNGTYTSKRSYDLNISVDRVKFQERIGFIQKYKNEKLRDIILANKPTGRKYKNEIKEVVSLGEMPVYDITVDNPTHTYWTGGLNVSNCGEIPLSEYGACILMCVNLKNLVEKPFTPEAKFMTSLFSKNLKIASRLIDDLLELEIEKIDAIIAKIKADPEPMDVKRRELELWEKILGIYRSGRRVGLGVTGLADLMARLGIKYDSKEALAFAEDLFRTFHMALMHENATLAQERGAFPLWDWELEKDSHYIRILPQSTQERIRKHGRRNISMTTVAPAGTISIMAQCSSGIEPVFKREYVRKRKINPGEIERGIKPDKTDADGIKWISYDVYHHGLEEWKAMYPTKKIEESPYWKCQADELDWRFRIRLQGVIQKYITHSISSTCNLPKEATEDEISKLYMMAWEEGLKGVTVYREGTRDGVMIKKESDERPKEVEHDIHYSTVEGHQWIFFVGSVEGKVYEIFGGRSSNIEIPKKYKKAWIVKNGKDSTGRRTYDLYLGSLADSDERMIIKDIASEFSNTAGSYTRMISLMLKSKDTQLHVICEQLNKDTTSHMFAFEKCVARVLKKYIKDGIRTTDVCEQCKGETFEYRDGCKYCVSCGNGKCG